MIGAKAHGGDKAKALLEAMRNRVSKGSGSSVRIGVPDSATEPDGTKITAVAMAHEFGAVINHQGGTSYAKSGSGKVKFVNNKFVGPVHGVTGAHEITIPARPFLAPAIVDAKPDISKLTQSQLKGVASGKTTVFVALERLGALAAGKVQQYIRNGNFAALKPETIRRKGSSKPLIDTGHMIQSITYEVHQK